MTHRERRAREERVVAELAAAPADDRRALMITLSRREGLGLGTIDRLREIHQLPLTPAHNRTGSDRTLQILAALLRGEKQVVVACRFGVSRQRINQVAQRALDAGIVLP